MDCDRDIVVPSAAALIEAMRAYGYSPPTAIADIIDNSISANCRNIWLRFFWSGPDSYISILDDGNGMTEAELIEAMRPGSMNPLLVRGKDDLGRFGLGLKTASFSQCRRLTVASKKEGQAAVSIRRWDLDYVGKVNEWALLKQAAEGSEERLASIFPLESGTLVLLERLDKIVDNKPVEDEKAKTRFDKTWSDIEQHLAMVFHRFLDGNNPALRILIQGGIVDVAIEPLDPFLESHPATIGPHTECLNCENERVEVRTFVLPHKDKLTALQHKRASGPKGWNGQQGFYVYRNRRLLVAGGWLGLGGGRGWTKEEHYKLARIQVDIPNNMDMAWQLDVKKSNARPPAEIRDALTRLAFICRRDAKAVFSHRGAYGARSKQDQIIRPWESKDLKDGKRYRIVRTHPLIQAVMESHGNKDQMASMLRLLEETVPVEQIWFDAAENPDSVRKPFDSVSDMEVRRVMTDTYKALLNKGLTPKQAMAEIKKLEEFMEFPALIYCLEEEGLNG